ncbi:unnamed protein product [Phyllotreta striolata]|uniref:Uncharacterized protein n=1 Tax=Phyllotreta striolata TaxID=444603 RepID=A0A9P0GWT3_PHYSR|nr:unnamed protein product [Phyllotreta striolata]
MTIMYGNMMRKFRMVNKMFQTVIKLITHNKRAANVSLKNEMLKSSKTLKHICLTFHFIFSPIAYNLYMFFQVTETTLPIKIMKALSLNRSYLLKFYHIMIFYIIPIHSITYIPTPVYTVVYCSRHIKFSLKQVVEEMKNFQQNDDQLKASITERLHSNKYQQKVKKELIYYIKQYNAIKRAADYVNHCIKWRFLSIFIVGGLSAAFNLVLILQVDFKSQIFQAGIVLIILAYNVITAECGEQIQLEVVVNIQEYEE